MPLASNDSSMGGLVGWLDWVRRSRTLGRLYCEARVALRGLTQVLPARLTLRRRAPRQRMLQWPAAVPLSRSLERLEPMLRARQLKFFRGKYSLYLPPQAGLADALGPAVGFYPASAGFKLIANASSGRPKYYWPEPHQLGSRFAVGAIQNQATAASALYALGVGPRVFDLTEISHEGTNASCFVVEHVDGGFVDPSRVLAFVDRLRELVEQKVRGAVALLQPEIFTPPCLDSHARNVVERRIDGRLFYVDPDQFILVDPRPIVASLIGSVASVRADSAELVRGCTRAEARAYERLRERAGLGFEGRVALDVAARFGRRMAWALSSGASWALGWVEPNQAFVAERLQCLLGNTRVTFVPAPSAGRDLVADVPATLRAGLERAVVFADRGDDAALHALSRLPWKALFLSAPAPVDERARASVERALGCRHVAEERLVEVDHVQSCDVYLRS